MYQYSNIVILVLHMSPSGDEESRWQCSTVALSSPWGSTGGAGLAMTALGAFQLEHTWSTLEEHLKGRWKELRWQWKPLRWNPGGAETPVGKAKWSPSYAWRPAWKAKWSPRCVLEAQMEATLRLYVTDNETFFRSCCACTSRQGTQVALGGQFGKPR